MTKKPTLISKAAFASQIGVGVKQVARYLREGKLDGAAVVRDGRSILIQPSIAKRQLAARLSAPTSGRRLFGANVDDAEGDDDAPAGDGATLNERIKIEMLTKMRLANARLEAEVAALAGRYVEAAAVEATKATLTPRALDIFEAQLPDLVAAVAGTFNLPPDEVAAIAADQMRSIRRRATAAGGRRMGNGKGH